MISAIGEETDLGALLFNTGFIFLHMALCIAAMRPEVMRMTNKLDGERSKG